MQLTRTILDYQVHFCMADIAQCPGWDITVYDKNQPNYALAVFEDIDSFATGFRIASAFVEGYHEGKKHSEPSQEVQSLNKILKTMAEETARICRMTTEGK